VRHTVRREYWIARLREGFAELSIDDSLGEQIR
jgi:hypothetical protein